MTLAQRLRARMQWQGINSQNQLARISGVPQSSIHRILTRTDTYAPARSTLQRLAAALDTTVPWLTDGVDGATPSSGRPPGAAGLHAAPPARSSAELHAQIRNAPGMGRESQYR